MADTGFKAKISIKRKQLPSSPIHVRIQAAPEDAAEGTAMPNPFEAKQASMSLPSSPRRRSNIKTPRGARGYYK